MSRLILFLLHILFLPALIPSLTFFCPHHRYRVADLVIWPEGLLSREHATRFVTGDRLIAREKVSTATGITPRIPVMHNAEGTYPLFDLLHYLDEYRSNHVSLLVFENRSDLHAAQWTLRYFNKNWIWLQVSLLKGPHGTEPTFTADDLEAEYHVGNAQKVWICYDMTTKPVSPYGYSAKHLSALEKVAFKGSLRGMKGLIMLDILHASHSLLIPNPLMKTAMEYVIFQERRGTKKEGINFKGLFRIIKALGLRKVYLDVSPSIRIKILEKYPDKTEEKKEDADTDGAQETFRGAAVWYVIAAVWVWINGW